MTPTDCNLGFGFYDEVYTQNLPTTRYFYDGQMCVEDEFKQTVNNVTTITSKRYGLGARGIDYIEKTTGVNGDFAGCQFPVYDAHGNMVLTVSRLGSSDNNPRYSSANRRSFDVWGSVRASADLGSPTNKQRYCANLGHVEDDESGLVYMRARYYEPWTGRFVSEDPARAGGNWYVYCSSNPIDLVDDRGTTEESELKAWSKFSSWLGVLLGLAGMGLGAAMNPLVRAKAIMDLGFLIVWWGFDLKSKVEGSLTMKIMGGLLINAMLDLIIVAARWEQYAADLAKSAHPGLAAAALIFEHVSFLSLFISLEVMGAGG